MGSYSYDRDVYSSSSYDSWGASNYSAGKFKSNTLDESLNPRGKRLVSKSKNPIIIVLDVTGSNINFARLVYDKMPMFYGEIESKKYLDDFDICFCAVGDALTDRYPIQIGDFAKGIEIDSLLEKIVLEAGGGGNDIESYELMAYYLSKYCDFEKGASPMLFFIADEGVNKFAEVSQVKEVFDEDIGEPVNPWNMLNEKFNNNVYCMLNQYCGMRFKDTFTNSWKSVLPSEHTILIHEEKSIVDLILGIIAMKKKELNDYVIDMKDRGQTLKRIDNVTNSLRELSNSALSTYVENDLPVEMSLRLSNKKGRRI